MDFPVAALRAWFLEERRDLPWRVNPTPYRVWISETMLQQTRVAAVLRYFETWMEEFPDIASLAEAPLEKVIKVWEGLGYYSRARSLHETAKKITSSYGGNLPREKEKLAELKGFGPYTIGALQSFAFHQKAAAVDGNVYRVITRYFLIEEDITKKETQKQITRLVEDLLPDLEPWVIMEALIELGATVCSRNPKCSSCPLQKGCLGYLHQKEGKLPVKAAKQSTITLFRHVPVITWNKEVLIAKEPAQGIMSGLYRLPYFEKENADFPERDAAQEILEKLLLRVQFQKKLAPVMHTFTRYKAHLFPTLWQADEKLSLKDFMWVDWEELKKLPFSSGYRKIIGSFQQ